MKAAKRWLLCSGRISTQAGDSRNLRHSLWEINQALGEGWVLADRETVSLNPKAEIALDVAQFRALLAEARTAPDP
ncbi:MAG: hypothetical protein HC938_14935, partial [Nitrospira sp.]|nr:hypothetical protein [Nitrospira sp.]